MDWWMNDWIHKVNILDSRWDEVGIGVGQVGNGYFIYVTDFANADGKDTSVAVTPPTEVQGAGDSINASESLPAGGLDYTVQGGDTLLAIGLRYGIEWQDIALANNMGENDLLSIGRTLRIPGREAATGESLAAPAAGGLLYTVKPGDTLITIGARYAIDWNDIAAANRLSDFSVLQIGMQLRLPGVPEEGETVDAANAQPESAAPSTQVALAVVKSSSTSYVVRAGDTLYTIAFRNKVTWQALAEVNGLDEDAFLQIGQRLLLPATAAVAAEPAGTTALANTPAPVQFTTELLPAPGASSATGGTTPIGRSYTVKAGDTVISIALRNNIGWKELLRINGLDDNSLLQPGQVLALGD
jgi:LysM repeat protein